MSSKVTRPLGVPVQPSPDVVNPDQVEATIEAKHIGARIRRLRLRRSMGLVELGQQTGLSPSFLSQLETGRVVATIRNLARVALVFGKDLNYFFREENPAPFRLSRAADRVRIRRVSEATPSFLSESMSALVPDRSIVPCLAEFELSPSEAEFHPRIFEGMEVTYLLEGKLILCTDEGPTLLDTGDVVWIDSNLKRRYCCPANTYAKALIITQPADGEK